MVILRSFIRSKFSYACKFFNFCKENYNVRLPYHLTYAQNNFLEIFQPINLEGHNGISKISEIYKLTSNVMKVLILVFCVSIVLIHYHFSLSEISQMDTSFTFVVKSGKISFIAKQNLRYTGKVTFKFQSFICKLFILGGSNSRQFTLLYPSYMTFFQPFKIKLILVMVSNC